MKLTIKILSILVFATVSIMILFSSFTIYILDKNLREDSVRSHQLIYSLFLPTITRYFWEFDISSVKETLVNIIQSEYATKIYVFDDDDSLVTSMVFDKETKKFEQVNDDEFSDSQKKIITPQEKEFLEKQSPEGKSVFLYHPTVSSKGVEHKEISRVIGSMVHNKRADGSLSTIGYIVFDYSTERIFATIKSLTRMIILASLLITVLLVISIVILLRKNLINQILKLSETSINIANGKFSIIPAPTGIDDEMKELVRSFNKMTNQIKLNQENLEILALEGIKISSCVTFHDIDKQVISSIQKITKQPDMNVEFFISSNRLPSPSANGYFKIGSDNLGQISYVGENVSFEKEDTIIFYVKDNKTRENSAFLRIDDLEKKYSFSVPMAESIYSTIQTLQISVSNALDNISYIKEQKEQQRLVNEQETARLVQNNLMPKLDYRVVGQYEISNYFESAEECAGDWWNYFEMPSGKLLVLLGDVTGHGTASAILTAVVKGFCDSLFIQPEITTAQILGQLDNVIRGSSDGSRVMTMFSAILDPKESTIEFANASHNFPFVIKKHEGKNDISKLIVSGKPLGMHESGNKEHDNYIYSFKKFTFEKGDSLFIYSDGLVEALNKNNEEYTERKVKQVLLSESNENIVNLKNKVVEDFKKFTADCKLKDDVTFMICRFIGNS